MLARLSVFKDFEVFIDKPLLCVILALEGCPNGKEPVSKTGGRKPVQVQILSPPHKSLTL